MRYSRRQWIALGGAALGLLAIGLSWWWSTQRSREVIFAIPRGAAAQQARGEAIQVLPQTIELNQNDTLIIRNDDSEPVQIGPFPVAPGQRFVQQYFSRGTYDLMCSLHQGERLRVIVR